MTWTFVRQFSLQGFAFVQGIILARILDPSDYGLIAMTTFFFAITGCFTDSGFGTALVRKKDRTAIDYSTVFVTNVCLTSFFALLLCLCSPLIASFYGQPILIKIVCANAILLFLNSFLAIQNTKLTIDLDFKAQNLIRMITNITIGVATIVMAYMGYGIWSLIWPNFLLPVLNGAMYWKHNHWFPGIKFSWKIWREFFSFGSKLLATNLLTTVFDNIYPLVIGKKFNATQLGYFTRAKGYADLPSNTLLTVLGPVAFPVLCQIQDDEERLTQAYRRLVRISAYLVFPMLIGLAVLARPAILILVTDKWAESIPYLQVLCFAFMWYPIHRLNNDILQVKGRSDITLKLEIIKKIFSVIVLVISIPMGLYYMCLGMVLSSIGCFLINVYYIRKVVHCGVISQILDIMPSIVYSTVMGIAIWIVTNQFSNIYCQLLCGIIVGSFIYFVESKLFKASELDYLESLLKNNVLNRFEKKE